MNMTRAGWRNLSGPPTGGNGRPGSGLGTMGATQGSSGGERFWNFLRDFFDPAKPTSELAADLYEWQKYGKIPVLSDPGAPKPPTPRAPRTEAEMREWGPDQSYNTREDMENYARAIQAFIREKQQTGEYDPSGGWIGSFQEIPWWVWAAGAGLLVWALAGVARR